jgi:lipopolysaccharide export LptBFGC system permease protein LptF
VETCAAARQLSCSAQERTILSTLHIYLLRQLLAGVAFAVGGMAFVAIPGIVVNAVNKVGAVSMSAVLGYLPMVGAELVPYLVPIGFLLALVATFGRLAGDNEWTAIVMAGIAPVRLLLMPLMMALALGASTHWLLANVTPQMKATKRNYYKNSVVHAFKNLAPGRTELHLGRFYLSSKARQGHTFFDVTIDVPNRSGSSETTLLADQARFSVTGSQVSIALENARVIKGEEDYTSGRPTIVLDLDQIFRIDRTARTSPKYQTDAGIRKLLTEGSPAERELRYELHHRLALASTYLMFLVLGIPTGLLLRRGTQLGALATAVGYALAYYLLSMRLGRVLAAQTALPPALAAWATNALGFVAGMILMRRAFWR